MLSLALFLPTSLAAMTPEETADRVLRWSHEGALELAGSLWTGPAAEGRKTFETPLRQAGYVKCVHVENIQLTEVTIGETTATIAGNVTTKKSDKQSPDRWMPAESKSYRVRLVRKDDGWRVSAMEFPDSEFADRLIAAASGDWRRLLRENPDRVHTFDEFPQGAPADAAASRRRPRPGRERIKPMAVKERGGGDAATSAASALERHDRCREHVHVPMR
ncbi:MAG TPA: hypothetical protein VMU84_05170 [Thermoanaerobaculia bacterium]|nr:hypothetical protein [Thermoanaerobaculia bacterium]